MKVKSQERRPNKRRKKVIAKEREKKSSPSSFFPAVWVSPCSPPVCPSSVPSLCPFLLSNGLSIHLVSVRPVHPIIPSRLSILPFCPSVHPYCPSALPFRPVSSTSLCPLSPSKLTFRFLKFPSGPPGQPGPSPLKKNIFFGGDKEGRSGLPCCQAVRGGTDVARDPISAYGIETNRAYVT